MPESGSQTGVVDTVPDSGLQTTEPKQAVQMVAEERLLDLAGKSFA